MHAYHGVTCHIHIEWEIVSYLLACRQILADHTGKNILADFEEIVHDFQITSKIFKAITDNASNMKKAFTPIFLPGFVLADSDESVDEEDHNIEEESGISIEEHEDHNQDLQLDVLQLVPDGWSALVALFTRFSSVLKELMPHDKLQEQLLR